LQTAIPPARGDGPFSEKRIGNGKAVPPLGAVFGLANGYDLFQGDQNCGANGIMVAPAV
jgi:hypothetical protein